MYNTDAADLKGEKRSNTVKRLLIAVLVLVLAALACNGGDSSGEKVGEVQSVDITEQEKSRLK